MSNMDNHILPRASVDANCGLVTPSIIMNHNIDCHEDIHPILAANISEYIYRPPHDT